MEASGVDAGCLTAEVLSPGRFGALVYDLENGWDLCDLERQRLARREIEDRRPWLLVASPPCMVHSRQPALHGGLRPEAVDAGKEALEVALEFVRDQVGRNGCFLLEHPWSATSRSRGRLRELVALAVLGPV